MRVFRILLALAVTLLFLPSILLYGLMMRLLEGVDISALGRERNQL